MFNGRVTDFQNIEITSDSFWGGVNVADFQQQRSIPIQIPVEMVKSVLIAAMHSVNLDLIDVETRYKSQGFVNAEAVSNQKINGENYVQTLYKKAVFARAKAELLPEFSTLSGREIHEKRQSVEEQKTLLAEAVQAIRTLKGKRRGSAYLI